MLTDAFVRINELYNLVSEPTSTATTTTPKARAAAAKMKDTTKQTINQTTNQANKQSKQQRHNQTKTQQTNKVQSWACDHALRLRALLTYVHKLEGKGATSRRTVCLCFDLYDLCVYIYNLVGGC